LHGHCCLIELGSQLEGNLERITRADLIPRVTFSELLVSLAGLDAIAMADE